ncbi:MAG: Lacal_2735 family protein [Schleiferiaceae bacterium]|nr:Lacal_2735 family protein [Schleiferiaceae bacterium]
MFGWLKSKSPEEKLEIVYRQKLKEAFDLSKVNRAASDLKTAEAEAIALELEALRKNKGV